MKTLIEEEQSIHDIWLFILKIHQATFYVSRTLEPNERDMIWPSLWCFKVYPLSSNLCYSKIFTDDNNYSFDMSMVYIFLSKHSWGAKNSYINFYPLSWIKVKTSKGWEWKIYQAFHNLSCNFQLKNSEDMLENYNL